MFAVRRDANIGDSFDFVKVFCLDSSFFSGWHGISVEFGGCFCLICLNTGDSIINYIDRKGWTSGTRRENHP